MNEWMDEFEEDEEKKLIHKYLVDFDEWNKI